MALGKIPYVDEDDLLDLAAEFGPGYTPVADLYQRYNENAIAAGRAPAPKRKLGFALKEAGWKAETRYHEGAARWCRFIPVSYVQRGREKHGVKPDSVIPYRVTKEMQRARASIKDDFATVEELEGIEAVPPRENDLEMFTWDGES